MSEKTADVPLSELARTFPVTVPSDVNGDVLEPKLVGVTICAPNLLPIQTRVPVGSVRNEFGETGSWVAFPAADLLVTLYPNELQAEGGCSEHPVLEAKTVAVDVAPVTTPEIAAANDSVRGVGFDGSEGSINTGDA